MISFVRERRNYDASNDQSSVVRTEIFGKALEVSGDPSRYAELSLSLQDYPTLLFTPSQYGLKSRTDEFVVAGDNTVYNGRTMVVKDVKPIAPDGKVIAARIIVGVG